MDMKRSVHILKVEIHQWHILQNIYISARFNPHPSPFQCVCYYNISALLTVWTFLRKCSKLQNLRCCSVSPKIVWILILQIHVDHFLDLRDEVWTFGPYTPSYPIFLYQSHRWNDLGLTFGKNKRKLSKNPRIKSNEDNFFQRKFFWRVFSELWYTEARPAQLVPRIAGKTWRIFSLFLR